MPAPPYAHTSTVTGATATSEMSRRATPRCAKLAGRTAAHVDGRLEARTVVGSGAEPGTEIGTIGGVVIDGALADPVPDEHDASTTRIKNPPRARRRPSTRAV